MKLTDFNVKGQMYTRMRLSQSAKAWQVINRPCFAIIPTVKPEVIVVLQTKCSRFAGLLEWCYNSVL